MRHHRGPGLRRQSSGSGRVVTRGFPVRGPTAGLASRVLRHDLERAMTLAHLLDRTPSGEPGPPPATPEADRTPVLGEQDPGTYHGRGCIRTLFAARHRDPSALSAGGTEPRQPKWVTYQRGPEFSQGS